MQVVPILRSSDQARSLAFYTQVLDFVRTYSQEPLNRFVLHLSNGDATIQLSREGCAKTPVNFFLGAPADVDALFATYVSRGLQPHRPESPVHCGPLDQSWGTREFYVDDPDGNTLRFCAWY